MLNFQLTHFSTQNSAKKRGGYICLLSSIKIVFETFPNNMRKSILTFLVSALYVYLLKWSVLNYVCSLCTPFHVSALKSRKSRNIAGRWCCCSGRSDGLLGSIYRWNRRSLVASSYTRLAMPFLWAALMVVLGTDDEGGVLSYQVPLNLLLD